MFAVQIPLWSSYGKVKLPSKGDPQMTITAYSRKFKRELDAKQLENLFERSNSDPSLSFRDFVKEDVECPACNVSGGYYVSEGRSLSNGKVVKQAHFAFRDNLGKDSHLPFCDFYTGDDKLNVVSNEGRIDFMRSGSEATRLIGLMVCAGIQEKIFTQEDIRNMRQWFLDLREKGTFTFNLSPHIIYLAKASLIRYKRNYDNYVVDLSATNKSWFDINEEVYQSLYFKYPQFYLNRNENPELWNVRLKSVVKKARTIVIKDSGTSTFDRSILNEKYEIATQMARLIRDYHPRLRMIISYTPTSIKANNPLMALSALLLHVSDWNIQESCKKIQAILAVEKVDDNSAGNIIGLNPFIHHSAWILVKALNDLHSNLDKEIDFDKAFNEEKERLMKIYYPNGQ